MPTNPYAKFNFLLEIEGTTAAGFTEVTGLNTETDVIDYREGSDPGHVRKIPALTASCGPVWEKPVTVSGS